MTNTSIVYEFQEASPKEEEPKDEGKEETAATDKTGNLQTSLVGTPSLASMTTDTAPVGSSADAAECVSGDDLHSHEGPSSPIHTALSPSNDVSGSRQLEETFAVADASVCCVPSLDFSMTFKGSWEKTNVYLISLSQSALSLRNESLSK